jgi:hypothetical protein
LDFFYDYGHDYENYVGRTSFYGVSLHTQLGMWVVFRETSAVQAVKGNRGPFHGVYFYKNFFWRIEKWTCPMSMSTFRKSLWGFSKNALFQLSQKHAVNGHGFAEVWREIAKFSPIPRRHRPQKWTCKMVNPAQKTHPFFGSPRRMPCLRHNRNISGKIFMTQCAKW